MQSNEYLRTSEHEDAVQSLEFVAEQVFMLEHDLYRWKWVIAALHNAAQGFMVLALCNGNDLPVRTKENAVDWLKAYHLNSPTPEAKLDNFLNLYRKCKRDQYFNYLGSKPFQATPRHNSSFNDLNCFRNDFTHFTPKGWSLRLEGLPEMVLDVLDLVHYFLAETTAILWYDQDLRTRARWAQRRIRRQMTNLSVFYKNERNRSAP
ncbi:hypothetical protein [Hydrogenophaga sp.]|uniref:hypothetical protein n=1 Tax=Hydrogenophaga sp. TaxID=1904254 RepID=UPI00272F4F0F|nr:hypothetical protein [Hydrogenophaga sp.]MDP1685708.1 hypothetical protein [Hydrogenophaga sp.]